MEWESVPVVELADGVVLRDGVVAEAGAKESNPQVLDTEPKDSFCAA